VDSYAPRNKECAVLLTRCEMLVTDVDGWRDDAIDQVDGHLLGLVVL